MKEYAEYVSSARPETKLEEARYLDSLHAIEKKIQEYYKQVNVLRQEKIDLESKLSHNCQEYITKKRTYHSQLKNLEEKVQEVSKKKSCKAKSQKLRNKQFNKIFSPQQ